MKRFLTVMGILCLVCSLNLGCSSDPAPPTEEDGESTEVSPDEMENEKKIR